VATTGSSRAAAVAAAGAALLGCAVLAGCGQAGPAGNPAAGALSRPGRAAGSATATAGGPASPAGRAGSFAAPSVTPAPPAIAAAPRSFCPARPAGLLTRALATAVPGSSDGEVVPLGAASDGRTAYVAAWTPGFSGVAALDLASGQLRAISPFASPASDQADGASAGKWLVWAQTYSLSDLDRFTVYAWNAATGRRRAIGRSLSGPGGAPWPSPWHAPAVSGNYAAWAQGYGPGGLVEIRLASLATGTVTTIRRGHVQAPFFDGDLLVWPESDTPGSETSLRAYNVAAHAAAPLPPVLASVQGTDYIVTDGTRTAYLSPDFTRLYYSPAQDQAGRVMLRLQPGQDFTDLALAPGSLAWSTTTATYLASTRTGAFTQVTPHYGYATGSQSVVLISDAPSQKSAHPPLPTHVVDPAAIDWPECQAG
jgi:hypothetical protein